MAWACGWTSRMPFWRSAILIECCLMSSTACRCCGNMGGHLRTRKKVVTLPFLRLAEEPITSPPGSSEMHRRLPLGLMSSPASVQQPKPPVSSGTAHRWMSSGKLGRRPIQQNAALVTGESEQPDLPEDDDEPEQQ